MAKPANPLAVTHHGDGNSVLEMILGMINDASDVQLAAVSSVIVGPTTLVSDDTFEVVLNGPAFAPVPIATFFVAFQTFLGDMQRAGLDPVARAAGRDTFKTALGPMATLIDWSEA